MTQEQADGDAVGASVSQSDELACIAALASDAWRLLCLSKRALEKLEPQDAARFANQVRFLDRRMQDELQKVGVKIVDLEGHRFDPGMAATPLNAEDFSAGDELRVEQMLEPVVLGRTGVLKPGVMLLGRRDA